MEHHLVTNLFSTKDLDAAWNLFKKAQKITFLTHRNPDADGVSACAALAHVMEKLGKHVEAIYPTKLESVVTRQAAKVLVDQHSMIPDLIVICDTANYDRLYYPDSFKTIPSINIDHHVSNSLQATFNFVAPAISSACELTYHLLQYWAADQVDEYVAQSLLLGILYDCQVFYIQDTSPQTLRTAADLMERGANLYELQQELLQNKSPEIIYFWGQLLSSVTIDNNGTFAWVAISQKDLDARGIALTSLIGFSNFLAQLSGVDISAILYETGDGKTKVSLRSKKADVNKIAGLFGGGGHKFASGILSPEPAAVLAQKLVAAAR